MKESKKTAGSAAARNDASLPTHREIQRPPSGGAAAEEQIRMRAYELYRERGGKVGDDMADWLQAEREYLERAPKTTTDRSGQSTSSPTSSATSSPTSSTTHG